MKGNNNDGIIILERFDALFNSMTAEQAIANILLIVLFTIGLYVLFKFLAKNNSLFLVVVFSIIMVLVALYFILNEAADTKLYLIIPLFFAIFVALIYSLEIKRVIWTKSKLKLLESRSKTLVDEEVERCVNEIIRALQNMSKNDVGAIIVLSNGNVPQQVLESGVELNCDISSALIESVFFPKTPLHDGAMIINGTKITAAGCFLPLSQRSNLAQDLGSRHRAAIGITETIDVTSLIVSEETGIISMVKAGKMTRYMDTEMLKKALRKFYWQDFSERKQ